MKPVIPDYEWIIFEVRVNMKTLLTSRCINQRGAGQILDGEITDATAVTAFLLAMAKNMITEASC